MNVACFLLGHRWGLIPTADVLARAGVTSAHWYSGRTRQGCIRCGLPDLSAFDERQGT